MSFLLHIGLTYKNQDTRMCIGYSSTQASIDGSSVHVFNILDTSDSLVNVVFYAYINEKPIDIRSA